MKRSIEGFKRPLVIIPADVQRLGYWVDPITGRTYACTITWDAYSGHYRGSDKSGVQSSTEKP